MSEAKKRKQKQKKNAAEHPVMNPAAAGIDIGATETYVAARPDCDSKSVRSFSTFTDDLHRLADWLKACAWYPTASQLRLRIMGFSPQMLATDGTVAQSKTAPGPDVTRGGWYVRGSR
jgi:hypothetical protein